MKIFRIGDTIPLNGVGFGTTDIRYIQEGAIEAFAALIKMKLPAGYNEPVILDGIVVSKVGTDYTHTAGHIYHEGFIYTVDERITQLASPGGSPKWSIQEVNADDNPVAFADGFTYNIDVDLKIILVNSAGTGIVDYDEIRRLEDIEFNKFHQLYSIITIPKLPDVDFLTDYFDGSGLGLPYKKYEGFAIADGTNDTIDLGGAVTVGYNKNASAVADVRGVGDYLAAAIGTLIGKFKRVIEVNNLPEGVILGGRTGTVLGGVDLNPTPGGGQYPNIKQISTFTNAQYDLGNQLLDIRQPSVVSIIIMKRAEITA